MSQKAIILVLRYEVLMKVNRKITIFWHIMSCNLVDISQRFEKETEYAVVGSPKTLENFSSNAGRHKPHKNISAISPVYVPVSPEPPFQYLNLICISVVLPLLLLLLLFWHCCCSYREACCCCCYCSCFCFCCSSC